MEFLYTTKVGKCGKTKISAIPDKITILQVNLRKNSDSNLIPTANTLEGLTMKIRYKFGNTVEIY